MLLIIGSLLLLGAIPALWWALADDGPDYQASEIDFSLAKSGADSSEFYDPSLDESAIDRLIKPWIDKVSGFLTSVTPSGMIQKLEAKIGQAGLRGKWTVERVLILKAASITAGTMMALLVATGDIGGKMKIGGIVLFLGIGWFAVDTVLSRRAGQRSDEIQNALPDFLDQVSISVAAGLGFESAVLQACRSEDGALIEEMGRALQDVQLGVPRKEALESILERADVADLRLFIRALNQADKTGVPIAGVLRVQAEEVREKRRQAAEERAMQMPVKLIFPLVLCILPALFLVIMGPAALKISSNGIGG